jgi:NTE family protein
MDAKDTQFYDVVMEGGGVKGIGLVGALTVLAEHGWRPKRVAGTSTGAIVGAMLAAGMRPSDMHMRIAGLKYSKLRDQRAWGPFASLTSLAVSKGLYEGHYIQSVLEKTLSEVGVRTFRDLRITEPWGKSLPPEQRYKLVVLAADVTRGQLVRLPWDYADYGLDPDDQKVADAVRASLSIPFFYKPYKLRNHLLVDGSILSRFPIDLFDTTHDWPTFGIKLWARPDTPDTVNQTGSTLQYAQAVFSTMINGRDQLRYDDPETTKRTIYIDTLDTKTTDFDIDVMQLEKIYVNGRGAAQDFLTKWQGKRPK